MKPVLSSQAPLIEWPASAARRGGFPSSRRPEDETPQGFFTSIDRRKGTASSQNQPQERVCQCAEAKASSLRLREIIDEVLELLSTDDLSELMPPNVMGAHRGKVDK